MDKPNLVGERFGRLTVIAKTDSKHNRSRWVCLCDCGQTCISTGHALQSGRKKSCNCLRREVSQQKAKVLHISNTLPDGEASFNLLYAVYRWQAEKRNLTFELSKDDFKRLTKGNCFYCGKEPKQIHFGSSCKTPYTYNGVDRQDNQLGYLVSNSVSCCKTCNDMKRTRTVKEFLNACESVTIHMNFKKSAEMTDSSARG
jgi:hypothetical protein